MTEHLSREERIQRIGELLSKGVTLMLIREAELKRSSQVAATSASGNGSADEPPAVPSPEHQVAGDDDTARSILDFLRRVGQASPRDIQRNLDLPKSTLYRHLIRLVQSSLVVGTGKTSAIRYRLAEPSNVSEVCVKPCVIASSSASRD